MYECMLIKSCFYYFDISHILIKPQAMLCSLETVRIPFLSLSLPFLAHSLPSQGVRTILQTNRLAVSKPVNIFFSKYITLTLTFSSVCKNLINLTLKLLQLK